MFKYSKQLFAVLAAASMLFVVACDQQGGKQSKGKSKTLKNTQSKGFVRCGVSQGLPGFSNADAAGNWTGVDVDVCRAVAAAVLGDASKVKYTPLSAKERFTALTSGEIDILSRNTTWTLSRDADIGLTFVGVNFYDGQGFMVRKDSGINSLMEDNFNKHLGNKLKLRRLALGLTQTKVAKAINVTFQQIQKYEKGTNGVSSIRLLQLANYLKVPVNYFFEDFSEYLINLERSQEGHMNVNYNFLVKLYSELNNDQKLKFSKSLQVSNIGVSKVG